MLFPAGSFPGAPRLETKKALLLIDLQNDFVNPNGKLPVKNVADFLPRLPGLVSKFRESGEIFWIQTQFTDPRPTISPELGSYNIVLKDFVAGNPEEYLDRENSPPCDDAVLLHLDPGTHDPEAFLAPRSSEKGAIARCCLPGTIGSRLPEPLASSIDQEKDVVLVKSHYSAFADASFLLNLRKKFVSELYLCGSQSNVSVYATALDAVRHGLSVTIIEDCVGYRNEICHRESMRQMADGMGAEGVELQELVDDLNGDLGEVVTETTFPTRFEVSVTDAKRSADKPRLGPRVQQWMSKVHSLSSTSDDPIVESIEDGADTRRSAPQPSRESISVDKDGALACNVTEIESHVLPEPPMSKTEGLREGTPSSLSPPRKRSIDVDFEQQEAKAMYASSRHRLSEEPSGSASKHPKPKANRVRVRKRKPKEDGAPPGASEDSVIPAPSSGNDGGSKRGVSNTPQSAGPLGNVDDPAGTADPPMQTSAMPNLGSVDRASSAKQSTDQSSPSAAQPVERVPSLGAGQAEALGSMVLEEERACSTTPAAASPGEGDSRICYNLLPSQYATQAFYALRETAQWQKMFHRSGEVPRLVAVQGDVHDDNSIPIYRHPADESPPLLPFSSTVQTLREYVEKKLHHPLNHVLIQLYRNGEDNISEHSDKTLDIVRGSDIVNLSLGAQRTMVLRAKKSSNPASAESGQPRLAQRIPLPHNSLFILGPKTNQHWLHSIRADKRRIEEKSPEELDFGGERISLTFRYVGTFISPIRSMIWGQGATAKEWLNAKKILSGAEAERAGESMIRAFGQENHRSHDFDWEALYGEGFDVVNFVTREAPGGGVR